MDVPHITITANAVYPKKPKVAWEDDSQEDENTFYAVFRRFSYIYKCIGGFPVDLPKDVSKIQFSCKSSYYLNYYFFLPCVCLLALKWIKFSDPLNNLKSYLWFFGLITSKLLFGQNIPYLIKLVQAMDSIDKSNCLKERNPKLTRKDAMYVFWIGLVTLLIKKTPQTFMIPGKSIDVYVRYVFTLQWELTLVSNASFFYLVCYQLSHLYDRYHASLAAILETPCEEIPEELLEDHRLMHAKLVNCIRLMDKTFGFWLAFVYVVYCSTFIHELYQLVYGTDGGLHGTNVLQVMWTLYFIFYPAALAHRFIVKNKDTLNFVTKMALRPHPENELFQVTYFLRQIIINVAAIDAASLAHVNMEIITKALSLFATFFVVDIQLEPQLQQLEDDLREALS